MDQLFYARSLAHFMIDLKTALAQAKAKNLYRQRRILESKQQPRQKINGQSVLSFCSNDYLGLASHPKVIEAFKKGADDYGVGTGSAHLINGHQAIHHQLEEDLAIFCQRPRALLFSTGYMANIGIISALLNRQDGIFQDRLNHASLIDGAQLSRATLKRHQHQDMGQLSQQLQANHYPRKIISTDGVFSMDGDIANIQELVNLSQQHQALLMVDDAHGFGVIGEQGRGCTAGYSEAEVPILMGTLGKAFGGFGAFVAGSEELIETLIQKARSYIYTTAMPAAIVAAAQYSLKISIEEDWRRQHLQRLIAFFKTEAQNSGLPLIPSPTAIQPILIGSAEKAMQLSQTLLDNGLLVSAIRPPTVPHNSARLRVTFSSLHQQSDIEQLLDILQKYFQKPAIF